MSATMSTMTYDQTFETVLGISASLIVFAALCIVGILVQIEASKVSFISVDVDNNLELHEEGMEVENPESLKAAAPTAVKRRHRRVRMSFKLMQVGSVLVLILLTYLLLVVTSAPMWLSGIGSLCVFGMFMRYQIGDELRRQRLDRLSLMMSLFLLIAALLSLGTYAMKSLKQGEVYEGPARIVGYDMENFNNTDHDPATRTDLYVQWGKDWGCPLSGGKVCQAHVKGAMCQARTEGARRDLADSNGNGDGSANDAEEGEVDETEANNQELQDENLDLEKQNEELKEEVEQLEQEEEYVEDVDTEEVEEAEEEEIEDEYDEDAEIEEMAEEEVEDAEIYDEEVVEMEEEVVEYEEEDATSAEEVEEEEEEIDELVDLEDEYVEEYEEEEEEYSQDAEAYTEAADDAADEVEEIEEEEDETVEEYVEEVEEDEGVEEEEEEGGEDTEEEELEEYEEEEEGEEEVEEEEEIEEYEEEEEGEEYDEEGDDDWYWDELSLEYDDDLYESEYWDYDWDSVWGEYACEDLFDADVGGQTYDTSVTAGEDDYPYINIYGSCKTCEAYILDYFAEEAFEEVDDFKKQAIMYLTAALAGFAFSLVNFLKYKIAPTAENEIELLGSDSGVIA